MLATLLFQVPTEFDAMHLYDPESLIDAKMIVIDGLSMDIPVVPANPASNFKIKPFDFFSQYNSVT